jgi:LemA protein
MDPSKLSAESMKQFSAVQGELSQALGRLLAVSEQYPDLKANQNFMKLQGDLTDTEDKIQAARRFYNGNVRDYNTKIQVFPTNLFASMFGFVRREFFGIDEKVEGAVPKVQF